MLACCCAKTKTSRDTTTTIVDEFADAGFAIDRWLSPAKVAKVRKKDVGIFTSRWRDTVKQAELERSVLRHISKESNAKWYPRLYEVPQMAKHVFYGYVHGVDLYEAAPNMPPRDMRVCLTLIVEAVAHMHSLCVAHLDIKPENIVLRCKNPRAPVLIDFEYAILVDNVRALRPLSARGTLRYMAPELRYRQIAGCPCDVYSLGETLVFCTSNARWSVCRDPDRRITAQQFVAAWKNECEQCEEK